MPGEPQHLEDVEVVVLEGDREGEDVEVAQRRARLEAHEGLPAALEVLLVHVVGQEGALADARRRSAFSSW